MKKIVIKLVIAFILCSMIPTVPLEAANTSVSFEESKNTVKELQELYKFNNSLAYIERDLWGGAVIRYFDSKTLKQTYKAAFDKSVRIGLIAENYFVINKIRKDSSKEDLYDRIVYSVKTGKSKIIAQKIDLSGKPGAIYNGTVFAYEDAIYDFDRNFSITGIKLIDISQLTDKTSLSYLINGKMYIFTPADLSLTAYPDAGGIRINGYILQSKKYGFIYIKDNSVFWVKTNGDINQICSYQSYGYEMNQNTYSLRQYGINRKGDCIYIINSPQSYVIVDLASGTFKTFAMPGSYRGIQFGIDDKTISLFYNYDKLAEQEWITDLSYLDKKGKIISLSRSAGSIAFYKNYVVYTTEIVAIGMTNLSAKGISVLNIDTGEEIKLSGLYCTFYITGEKLYANVNSVDYVFDPNKKTFLALPAFNKYIGDGVYMVSQGADVTFQDVKKAQLTQFWRRSSQTVCAVLPGSKKGFLYDGTTLKNITFPDANKYTKSSDFKIIDNYISYRYPVVQNGKTYTYIRIVKV
ncbi:hypothetical protein [Ruminiclostridium cellobioparum]|uniref:hypothetical protein n=1 Tax=Ruminiclostridium cellobioparum TaxID=29355 RepID=UPI0028ADB603|nr:hypothetical protein [Ruminiclostridium cellobioparum]